MPATPPPHERRPESGSVLDQVLSPGFRWPPTLVAVALLAFWLLQLLRGRRLYLHWPVDLGVGGTALLLVVLLTIPAALAAWNWRLHHQARGRRVRPTHGFGERLDVTVTRLPQPDGRPGEPIAETAFVRFVDSHPQLGPDDRTFGMRNPVTGEVTRRRVGRHVALLRLDGHEVTLVWKNGQVRVDAVDHPDMWRVLSEMCATLDAAAVDDTTGERMDR